MEELAGIVVMMGPALVHPIWQEFVLEGTLLSDPHSYLVSVCCRGDKFEVSLILRDEQGIRRNSL